MFDVAPTDRVTSSIAGPRQLVALIKKIIYSGYFTNEKTYSYPVRVLHFYKTYYPHITGGIQQVIHQIAQACLAYDIQTEILTLSYDPSSHPIEWQNERIHQVKCHLDIASTPFSFSAIHRFRELANQADVIHYHYPWPFMDMVHFTSRVKKPTVLSYQADIVKQKYLLRLYQPLAKRFLHSVTRVIASSPQYLESSPLLQEVKHKTDLIPIGIAKAPAPSAEKLAYWRNLLGERFFLFVGVLRYYKGLTYLLEALKETHLPMVIAGTGPMEASLKAQAKELGLTNLRFTGAILDEDKFALLSLCTAFVFPSHLRAEAYGVSLLEAAMMGKPMISCTIQTGTSFINCHGLTGWEVPPANALALKHAMQACWDHPEQAQERGSAAQERYEALFTAEKMGRHYAQLYQQIKANT